jgi:TolA-binding protein
MNKTYVSLLAISILAAGVMSAFAEGAPSELYQQAIQLESSGKYTQALSAYQQVISQYPDDPMAGPDNAGFKVKYLNAIEATRTGDRNAVKTIAAEIMLLNTSPKEKPNQLYSAGVLFENSGFEQEALSAYQQVMSQHPDSLESSSDNAGFHIKYLAGVVATRKGDSDAVKNVSAEIRSLNTSPLVKPNHLYVAGVLLEGVRSWQDAQSVYQQIITEYPDTSWAQAARIHKDGVELLKSIYNGDIAAAKTGTAGLKAKYAGSSVELANMLITVGEAYYTVGMEHNKSEFFQQSISLFENESSSLELSGYYRAGAFYMLGLNYDHIEDYAKAAAAFANSYQTDPNFTYADYCLFAIGRCFEKMVESKTISITQAKPSIERVYTEFIKKYPNSSCIHDARHWMENNK